MSTELQAKKRERVMVREYILRLQPMWTQCFWTRPFMHDYSLTVNGVECCRYCLRPSVMQRGNGKLAERYAALGTVFGEAKKRELTDADWPTA